MQKYYDKACKRLIFISEAATPKFWDTIWETNGLASYIMSSVRKSSFVYQFTRKYLPTGSRILEGGCGRGQYVFAMREWGYDVLGVDTALSTIAAIRKVLPDMPVQVADVTCLPLDSNSFDGYWSFGVIEHFFDGYKQVKKEMYRILKPDGYLFITFPHMSILRKCKALLGLYKQRSPSEIDREHFYQFALNRKDVIHAFEQSGFVLKTEFHLDGLKGIKDEIPFLGFFLRMIYDKKGFVPRLLSALVNRATKRFASHSILVVFQKSV